MRELRRDFRSDRISVFARLFFLHVTYTNFLPVNIKLIRYGYSRITIFSPFFFLLSFVNVYTMLSFERLSVFLRFIDRRSRGGAHREPESSGREKSTGSKRDDKGSGAVVVTQLCTVLVCVATKSSLRNLEPEGI